MSPGPLVVAAVPWTGILPLAVLVAAALLILVLEAFTARGGRASSALAVAALAAAAAATAAFLARPQAAPFPGMYGADRLASFADLVVLLAAFAAIALARGWHPGVDRAEYPALVLLAAAGMMALDHAENLVTVFLGIELLSVVLYVLSGFLAGRERAVEAALKYFFLGAFSSGFLLYGMAFIYGTTGALDLATIAEVTRARVEADGAAPALLVVGAALVFVGFGFKVSSVPFHMWTPDVYEGAPTPVTAFMSVGTKTAAFVALLRVLVHGLGAVAAEWRWWVAAAAVATMMVGNLVALTQRDLKRLLAYSSIAHAGYLLVGVVAWDHGGGAALLYYLGAYAFMNLGAFAVVAALEHDGHGLRIHQLGGLARRRPILAAAMALFLLSLAGMPPTAGFLGKFGLLLAAVEAGWTVLAVLAVAYSTVAAYVYLRLIVVMYMQPEPQVAEPSRPLAAPVLALLGAAAVGVVVLGVAPGGLLRLLEDAVAALV